MPNSDRARRVFLPPHQVRHHFLPPALADDLLAFAVANENRFVASAANRPEGPVVDPAWRISRMLPDPGPFAAELEAHVMPLADGLMTDLHIERFKPARVELSLVAHEDGAFLSRHIDFLRAGDAPTRRMLSGVYYFHARPKGFSGGALRLHEVMARGPQTHYVDVEPVHNSMLFFAGFMPHEVRPVSVPSGRFADSRFSMNFWIHRAK